MPNAIGWDQAGPQPSPSPAQFRQLFQGMAGAAVSDKAAILAGSAANGRQPFKITVFGGVSPQATVAPGVLDFRGLSIIVSTQETVNIPPNISAYERVDALCVEIDYDNNDTSLVYKAGAPSASNPQPPDLTQGANRYELPLAYITVPSGQAGFGQDAIEYITGFTLPAPYTAAPFYNSTAGRIPLGYPVKLQEPTTTDRAIALCNAGDALLGVATQEIGAGEWGGVATSGIPIGACNGIIHRNQNVKIGAGGRFERATATNQTVAQNLDYHGSGEGYSRLLVNQDAGKYLEGVAKVASGSSSIGYTTSSGVGVDTFVDVDPDKLGISLTTFGGDVLVGFTGSVDTSFRPVDIYFNLSVDDVDKFPKGITVDSLLSTNSYTNICIVVLLTDVPAGAHTFKLRWSIQRSSTIRMRIHRHNPQFWVREL